MSIFDARVARAQIYVGRFGPAAGLLLRTAERAETAMLLFSRPEIAEARKPFGRIVKRMEPVRL